ELTLGGDARAAPLSDISALRRRLVAGARVLVVTSDDTQAMTIEDVLAEDGMVALPVPDMHAALTRGTEHLPDLAIIDADLPHADGIDRSEERRVGKEGRSGAARYCQNM